MAGTHLATRIELLTRENYDSWKIQVKALLIKNDAWDYVSGKTAKPAGDAEAIAAWEKGDQKAMSDLILLISPPELRQFRGINTSKELFEKIQSVFASSGPARKGTLLKQLMQQRMREGSDVHEHLRSFFCVVDQLDQMEVALDRDMLSILLLCSLPASFENFRCAVEARDEVIALDILKVKIIEEYEARKSSLNVDTPGAMAADRSGKTWQKFRKQGENSSKKSSEGRGDADPRVRCFKCRELGHKANNCPQRTSKKYTQKSSASAGEVDDNVDDTFAVYKAAEAMDECAAGETCESQKKKAVWLLDSGCTSHLCGDKEHFTNLDGSIRGKLNLASSDSTGIEGKGAVRISAATGQGSRLVEFKNTLYIPDLRVNLVSVSKIVDQGHSVTFTRDKAVVESPSGEIKMKAYREGDLFYIQEPENQASVAKQKFSKGLWHWHECFGHLNGRDLAKILEKTHGIKPSSEELEELRACEICLKGKMAAIPFPEKSFRCTKRLDIIHSDVVGPMRTESLGGARYFVTFIDDSTRWVSIYLLRQKKGVLEAFRSFKNLVEKQFNAKIKCLQSDNGREYLHDEFNRFLDSEGIERRLTVKHTPEQNGLAERMNRTLLDMARCMLLQADLSKGFWGEAVAAACHTRNRCPSNCLGGLTPYEKWTNKPLEIDHLKPFGGKVYVLDKTPQKGKFDPRAHEGIFVGYPRETKGFRVWIPEKHKIEVARDVRFVGKAGKTRGGTEKSSESQEKMQSIKKGSTAVLQDFYLVPKEVPRPGQMPEAVVNALNDARDEPQGAEAVANEPEGPEEAVQQFQDGDLDRVGFNDDLDDFQDAQDEVEDSLSGSRLTETPRGPGRPRILRTGRRGRPRKIFQAPAANKRQTNDSNHTQDGCTSSESTDREFTALSDMSGDVFGFAGVSEISLKEALACEDSAEWKEAIYSEIKSLVKNNTWKIVPSSQATNIVGCKFVLTNKYGRDGVLERRKARLVAKGYSQKFGVDYHHTFAPVARLETIRLVCALAAELKLTIFQVDITTAYLNGTLNENIYMQQPDLLRENLQKLLEREKNDSKICKSAEEMLCALDNGGSVCHLQKALYGLKQAGRQWNQRITDEFKAMGLKAVEREPCLYFARRGENYLLVVIYVDDILIASQDEDWIKEFKTNLGRFFEVKDLGLANFCLGIEILQKNGAVILSQKTYIQEILKRYKMEDCKAMKTPMETGWNPVKSENQEKRDEKWPFRELIGALLYLAVATRPDLANSVAKLAQFVSDSDLIHWQAAKRILRYLQGSSNVGLVFTNTKSVGLYGMTDAEWGGCSMDRRSYSGYVFYLGGAGISWKSSKQPTTALSSTEAEYMGLTEAAKESVYLQGILNELELGYLARGTIYVDNQGAMYLAQHPAYHRRTKHIDIRYHYIRELVKNNQIILKHLSTENMVADIFTKALPGPQHARLCEKLGLKKLSH